MKDRGLGVRVLPTGVPDTTLPPILEGDRVRKGVQGTGILAGIIARVPSLLASNPSGEKGMREGIGGGSRVKVGKGAEKGEYLYG